jgi:hypothetical protein
MKQGRVFFTEEEKIPSSESASLTFQIITGSAQYLE